MRLVSKLREIFEVTHMKKTATECTDKDESAVFEEHERPPLFHRRTMSTSFELALMFCLARRVDTACGRL
jgi:hypothetical protein